MASTHPRPMVPTRYRVRGTRPETVDTVTLELEAVDEPLPPAAPGQFHMLWAFGIGEIPVSVSGVPATDGALLHTIRAVGPVTQAICTMEPGAVLGVRGPFGTDWRLEGSRERDVVVIAGGIGIAPLRTAVTRILADRARYGRVAVLVGARSPEDLVYAAELERWRGRFDLELDITVDHATPPWRGDVGVVTKLLARAPIEPGNTDALICGPEIMMRFAAQALIDRGVATDRILLAMERNMQCAIGQCGHCLFGPAFVCKEGSVFSYDRVAPMLAVREL